jgi:pantoate--beta-alanine ligase
MNSIKVFESISEFIQYRNKNFAQAQIGFVPTMGALHQGHASLLKKSSQENDISILSIYVNPTQFNNADDLKKYPRTWEADLDLAQKNGTQIVISPRYEEIYADQFRFKLTESDFSKILCGAHRRGHFDGVLTVVMKLLQITKATKAYFGEKDFQQLQLIKDMVASFFLSTEIIGCATFRELDGLAMSSRNVRLTESGRKKAPLIYQALTNSKTTSEAIELLNAEQIQVEYLEEHYGRRFIAAFIDEVRLIDNVKI